MTQLSLFSPATPTSSEAGTPSPTTVPDDLWSGAEVISLYTRAQALADGVLVDVSGLAREAGFKFPVAVTADLQAALEPGEAEQALGQDYTGRLWDVLWMLRCAIRGAGESGQVRFRVILATADGGKLEHPGFGLLAVCGPGDDLEPAITVGFPNDF